MSTTASYYLTGLEYAESFNQVFISHFDSEANLIESREFKTDYWTVPAKSLRIINENAVVFSGALRGIGSVAF